MWCDAFNCGEVIAGAGTYGEVMASDSAGRCGWRGVSAAYMVAEEE